MKKRQKNRNALLVLAALTSSSTATITFLGGNLDAAANWQGGAFPQVGETGEVDVDSTFSGSGAGNLSVFGDLVFGGGSTLTATIDFVAVNPTSVTFNDVTVNVADDIFTGGTGGNFIFNAGSVTSVADDFEANGGGTITINGGQHTLLGTVNTSNFGAQRISTLNFLGGSVTADVFRTTDQTAAQQPGGTINIGGDAVLDVDSTSFAATGVIDFSSAWTGELDSADLTSLSDWFTALDNGTLTFDGATLDQTIFDNNFQFENGALSLVPVVVPEPSSLSLLGLSALFLARRRVRK